MKNKERSARSSLSTMGRLAREIGQYKKPARLSPLCTLLCVVLEILIPYLTASIIDDGISVGNMGHVVRIGALMAAMALLAMFFGVRAGEYSARASTGFAANLRGSGAALLARRSWLGGNTPHAVARL